MSTINRNQAPYYDDYNPQKNYSHMLAVPGHVEQARDFTQAQTMIFDYLQRLSDTLFKNGSVVSGMGFVIKESSLLVESGKVYMNGKIHNFEQQEVPFSKSGEELVGVILNEEIITEEQDLTLLDPTTSTGNYGQPGTHRIKSTVQLAVNDPDVAVIYEFFDGNLQSEVPRPQFDGLADMLAKRTYDQSGNYRVNGLDIVTEPLDANNIQAIVEAGTAYVLGYQVIKPTPIKRAIPMSKQFSPVVGEPKTFVTGQLDYELNNTPIKTINRITAYVQVDQTVTRGGTPGGIDYLNNTPVVDVLMVRAGATTYVKNTDYKLTNNGIDWSPSGAEPTSGTAYTVTYTFNKTLVQGTDYKLHQITGEFGESKDYVRFLAGDKPSVNTTFYVDYDFYLARIDLLSLNKNGELIVTTGQSDLPRNVKPPVNLSPELLHLGAIYLPPNSARAVPSSNTVTRMEMAELQRMAKRVEDIEFNQAVTALDREALEGEIPTDLRGIFSDSFRALTRANLGHPNFNIMYDLEMGTVMLPIQATKSTSPTIVNPGSLKMWRRTATVPFIEKVTINQPYATTTMLVNPYLAFNSMGVLNLNPAVDNWIEDAYMKLEETVFKAQTLWRWWRHPEDPSRMTRLQDIFDFTIEGGVDNGKSVGDWRPGIGTVATAVKTEKSKSIVNEAITHMRQITVTLHATNLQPSTDNLECFFDGIRVALTPVSGYTRGAIAGTMRANTSGEVKATFTIPPSIRTGTREVTLRNATNTASTSFTAIGTKRTTIDKILHTRITLTAIDPLAQTFQFDRDTVLTSVGAYFSSKNNVHNVVCQIRNVVNGYPGNVILGEKVLTPSQILVSGNANTETKVSFDEPIVCAGGQQYCMVFLTDSDVHSMYVCDLGQKDITTGAMVTRQPYLAGMLFSSSNGLAWTAHQSMNLKFKVYTASFNKSATIDFVEQTNISADRVLLLADAIVPMGTACNWQISLDGAAYQPIMEYNDLDLVKVASKIKLRAVITTDGYMSPIIATDSINLIGFTTSQSGSYLGRNVELEDIVTDVKQIFDAYVPNGCSVTAQFSHDKGTTWVTSTVKSQQAISSKFTRYICEAKINSSVQAKNFIARLNITSNNPVLRPEARRFVNIMK